MKNQMHVIDMTALPGQDDREHQILVDGVARTFKFKAGKPTALPPEIAVKFLKTDTFKLTDEKGTVLPWRGVPRQPDELQAGEKLILKPEEVVANLDELHDDALWLRVAQLPGGEKANREDRDAMISYIITTTEARKKANTVNEADPDSFTPEAEADDFAA